MILNLFTISKINQNTNENQEQSIIIGIFGNKETQNLDNEFSHGTPCKRDYQAIGIFGKQDDQNY